MFSHTIKHALAAAVISLPFSTVLAGTPKACLNPQLSCSASADGADLCCFNSPGGQLLLTQFWDTNPPVGPSDRWTIHGLWPDNCDGTYIASCDSSRYYHDLTGILKSFGKDQLLSDMQTYWKDYKGNDEKFWSHEWNKHGTCISTLNPSCYTGYKTGEEFVDFAQITMDLYKSIDSYAALAKAGIVPSNSKTYNSADIYAALKADFGYDVTIGCHKGQLDEIWYAFKVRGSVQTGEFVRTDPDGTKSTCPKTGVKYVPKSGSAPSSPKSPKMATPATSTPATPELEPIQEEEEDDTPIEVFSGQGYLEAITNGDVEGCLVSAGSWLTENTCATYTATASDSGFTLESSKGVCGFKKGAFACGSDVTQAEFTAIDGQLAYNSVSIFYANEVPSANAPEPVYTTSKKVAVSFQWQEVA